MFPFAKGLSDVALSPDHINNCICKRKHGCGVNWNWRLSTSSFPSIYLLLRHCRWDCICSPPSTHLLYDIPTVKNDIFQMCFISTNFFYRPNIKNRQLFPFFGIQIKPYPNILLRHSLSFRRSEKWQTCSLSRYREQIITRCLFIS